VIVNIAETHLFGSRVTILNNRPGGTPAARLAELIREAAPDVDHELESTSSVVSGSEHSFTRVSR
jgi:hypothetical protein